MQQTSISITTTKLNIYKYFVVKQEKHLIIQLIIKRYTINKIYLKTNTQK